MAADDDVHAVLGQSVGNLLLGGADFRLVFAAPVDHGYNDVGVFGLGGLHGGSDARGVDGVIGGGVVGVQQVHAVFRTLGDRQVVDALGKADKGHPNAVDLFDHHLILRLVLGGRIGAQGGHAVFPDNLDGALQSRHTVLDGIGVGRLQDIHAETGQGGSQGFRGTEIGIPGGFPAEIGLEVGNGHVGGGQHGADGSQGRQEIVGAVGFLGVGQLGVVNHDITHGGKGGRGGRRQGRGIVGVLLLLLLLLGIVVGGRRFFAAAAAGNKDDDQKNHQGGQAQNDALADNAPPFGLNAFETAGLQALFIALVVGGVIIKISHRSTSFMLCFDTIVQ